MAWLRGVPAAAKYAGVGKRTFRKWMKHGLTFSKMPTGCLMFSTEDIDKFIRSYSVSENEVDKIVNEILKEF